MQRWRGVIVRAVLALLGLVILASVLDHVGIGAIATLVAEALPWMPLALVLEGARIGCDAVATGVSMGPRWRDIGALRLYLAHVAGHGVMNVMPGGRSASELVKAGLFYEVIGASEAAAVGTSNQANVLLSSALFSIPCGVAAFFVSTNRTLTWAIAIHALVLFGSGIGVRYLASSPHVEAFVHRRLPRWRERLARFHASSRDAPLFAPKPVGWMMLGRLAQTLQYGVLAHAVGLAVGPLTALTVQGTNLVAAAVGVLVPGQMGSSEGVFMLAAEALGTTAARATSVALLAHASGIVWTVMGFVILAVWRSPARGR